MYLALTYDHRMLDGREAVVFLVKAGFSNAYIDEANECLRSRSI